MITPLMRISYPYVWEPKANLSGALKYSCSLLISKDDKAGVAALNEAVNKAIAKGKEKIWEGKVPKFRYAPLRDGDEELASGEKTDPVYKNTVFLNCSSDNPPQIVVATGAGPKPLLDTSALFAGCWVRVDVNPFPYKRAGNCGVGWGLNNIMLVKEDERLDGRMRATDAFADFAPIDAAASAVTEETASDSGDLV